MELKLENGQYVTDHSGKPETVSGWAALLQRAQMRLAAKRGSFLPDPEYGSRLYRLGTLKASQRASAARLYAAEALKEEPELRIGSVDYRPGPDGSAVVEVELLCDGGTSEVSIQI